MMDLQTRLERFGGPIEPTSSEAVEADVLRGRRAVQRRRTVQAIGGSAFSVAAIVAAVSFLGTGGGTTPGIAGSDRSPAVAESSSGVLTLVDYRGPQPKHFVLDKVPQGYFIQKDYYGGLTIAPDYVKNPSPNIDPSKQPMYDPQDMLGKIAIFLQPNWQHEGLTGETFTVGAYPATLHRADTTWQLILAVSPKVNATIQFDVPMSREDMLELGAGLHVRQDAIDRMATSTGKTEKTDQD